MWRKMKWNSSIYIDVNFNHTKTFIASEYVLLEPNPAF
jgi:hypothetical protein